MEGLANRKRWQGMVARADRWRMRCDELSGDLVAVRGVLFQTRQEVIGLKEQLARSREEIQLLEAQLAAATPRFAVPAAAQCALPRVLPWFVKANHVKAPARPPGQKPGHLAAHRPMPAHIDQTIKVPLPRDSLGHASCPQCHSQLLLVQSHRRIVEDLLPQRRVVHCYHTMSGYCPSCRKRVESRGDDQPPCRPGSKMLQGQLGLGALATCALLRMQYRLPYRQITQLFLDLPGIAISPGGLARQIGRMGRQLESFYGRLKSHLQRQRVVHIDETGWRVGGVNHWLWTLCSPGKTFFHIDKSRSRRVAQELLGPRFKGTLVSDFYSAYHGIRCQKQQCLAHLLREFKETAQLHRAFAKGAFYQRGMRLIRWMFLLKARQPATGRGPPKAMDRYQQRVCKLDARLRQLARGPEGGWQEPESRRLAKRLARYAGELTCFLRHRKVPPPTMPPRGRCVRPSWPARYQGETAATPMPLPKRSCVLSSPPLTSTTSPCYKPSKHSCGLNGQDKTSLPSSLCSLLSGKQLLFLRAITV